MYGWDISVLCKTFHSIVFKTGRYHFVFCTGVKIPNRFPVLSRKTILLKPKTMTVDSEIRLAIGQVFSESAVVGLSLIHI